MKSDENISSHVSCGGGLLTFVYAFRQSYHPVNPPGIHLILFHTHAHPHCSRRCKSSHQQTSDPCRQGRALFRQQGNSTLSDTGWRWRWLEDEGMMKLLALCYSQTKAVPDELHRMCAALLVLICWPGAACSRATLSVTQTSKGTVYPSSISIVFSFVCGKYSLADVLLYRRPFLSPRVVKVMFFPCSDTNLLSVLMEQSCYHLLCGRWEWLIFVVNIFPISCETHQPGGMCWGSAVKQASRLFIEVKAAIFLYTNMPCPAFKCSLTPQSWR